MLQRTTLLMLALALSGCANESKPDETGLLLHLGAPMPAAEASSPADMSLMPERQFGNSLSTRVLSAIAFERSTGFTAHPSRIVPNY